MYELGVPHPLHVHSSNLGLWPATSTSTLGDHHRVSRDCPIAPDAHPVPQLTAPRGRSQVLLRRATALPRRSTRRRIRRSACDVGQVTLRPDGDGQSGDSMSPVPRTRRSRSRAECTVVHGHRAAMPGAVSCRFKLSRPELSSTRCSGPSGSRSSCSINDPWRVFLTTDHPNGGAVHQLSAPHPAADGSVPSANEQLGRIQPDARAAEHCCVAASITRVLTLYEIAILTTISAGSGCSVSLKDRGHLGDGAYAADITVYRDNRRSRGDVHHALVRLQATAKRLSRDGKHDRRWSDGRLRTRSNRSTIAVDREVSCAGLLREVHVGSGRSTCRSHRHRATMSCVIAAMAPRLMPVTTCFGRVPSVIRNGVTIDDDLRRGLWR